MEIRKKFEAFESSGESDKDDLEARLDNFREADIEGKTHIDRSTGVEFFVEIKNHV